MFAMATTMPAAFAVDPIRKSLFNPNQALKVWNQG